MAKHLVIHALPSPVPLSKAEEVAKAAKANSNADIYWVSSWVQLDEKGDVAKIFCEWDAKDATVLKNLFEQMKSAFPDFPVEGPYPMMKVEGESYR